MRLFSMRRRLMFIFALAVALPLIVSGYILIHRAEQALNLEKESKLFGMARVLDKSLVGDFESLLPLEAKNTSHDDKVRLLNIKLSGITEQIVLANPGVGAGYYSKDFNCFRYYYLWTQC